MVNVLSKDITNIVNYIAPGTKAVTAEASRNLAHDEFLNLKMRVRGMVLNLDMLAAEVTYG
jgi:hypothetical protein